REGLMDAATIENNERDRQEQTASQLQPASSACAQCPLHFAMQRLTRAAVSQLVYYADGEYMPRANLLGELDRWERLHATVATRICPAGREAPLTAADLRAA